MFKIENKDEIIKNGNTIYINIDSNSSLDYCNEMYNLKEGECVYNYLLKYFDLDVIEKMTTNQKIYHFLYDVKEIPLCKECGKNYVQFNEAIRCYKTTCSGTCNNHFIRNIDDFKVVNGENNVPLILTKDGWSEFDGIIKYENKETYSVTINNTSLRCTSDHLILNNENKFVEAKNYKLSDKKYEDVYDIINVKKGNSFIVNGNITVHNCLVLDEFAFIAPSCLLRTE